MRERNRFKQVALLIGLGAMRFITPGVSLVDELIAERREAAKREFE
jgi:hypothetical protein